MQTTHWSSTYSGYFQTGTASEDEELTHVEPGTPCGEYLRCFWQPVALSTDVMDRPLLVRILGEDLVLFRDKGGRLGLLHRHCAHRRASLEFGVVEQQGLRCCYHGWLFDIDGTILEAPAEPRDAPVKRKVRQGAYPVFDYKGMIFAYLGSPEKIPEFPVYDTFEIPGDQIVCYNHDFSCNWLQVLENSMDHIHVPFLHTRATGAQFGEVWGQIPRLEFYKGEMGLYYTYSRRVADNIWVGSEDIILPNVTQAGAVFEMDGRNGKYFGRNAFTRWVVPLDSTHTRVMAMAHFNERSDPLRPERVTPESLSILESGTVPNRPYHERQQQPGDDEALVGIGPIAIHSKEHLVSSDRGVALLRARLRKEIRDLVKTGKVPAATDVFDAPIPTYGGDSVLRIPKRASDQEDEELIRTVAREVMAIYRAADSLRGIERDDVIRREVQELERKYGSM